MEGRKERKDVKNYVKKGSKVGHKERKELKREEVQKKKVKRK